MPIYEPQLSAGISTVGNTAGTTGFAHDRVMFVGSNNITLSQSVAGNSATVSIIGATAAGDGLNRIAAGTQTAGTLATVNFANSNGITFGMSDSSQITASHNGLTTQTVQPVAISGSNGSFTFNTVTFGNLNGFSFYTSNGSVVGSYTAAGAADGVNILAAGTQTANTTGTVIFNNANGVTFGMANSSQITASHNGLTTQTVQPVAVSAANGSFAFSTATFANSNGVSFSTGTQGIYATVATNYQSQGAYLTTARASNDAIGLNTAATNVTWTVNSGGISLDAGGYLTTAAQSGHSHGNPTLNLTNINGTTNSASNGLTLSLSVPQQSIVLSGSNGSLSASAFTFGNLNGLSFYTSNGSIVGSYTDAGAGGGISAINVSAGTTSNNMSAVTFSNANGVSFGLNGSTVTASVAGAPTLDWFDNCVAVGGGANGLSLRAITNRALSIFPINVQMFFPGNMTVSTAMFQINNSGSTAVLSAAHTTKVSLGVYVPTNGSQLSLINSVVWQQAMSANTDNYTAWQGQRFGTIHSSQWSSTPTFSVGDYVLGWILETSGSSAGTFNIVGQYMLSNSGATHYGNIGESRIASNNSIGQHPWLGQYSVTTTGFPSVIGLTDMAKTAAVNNFMPRIIFNNLTKNF